ncbi:hypothetical protein RUND412_005066 [Rhizina undulata]
MQARSITSFLRFKLFLSVLALSHPIAGSETTSTKRGLVYIPSSAHPEDNNLWSVNPSQLSWYYNYQSTPSSPLQVSGSDRKQLEFVPMLWGDTDSAGTFVAEVKALKDRGETIRAVIGPNEPDMPTSVGGSNITPARAADIWRADIEPLAALGLRLGSPAISSSTQAAGWLKSFLEQCSDCTISFLAIHWYGNFEGLASHLGYINAQFPGRKIWVTEMGYPNQDLATTEAFFNQSVSYLEGLAYVERYSWFGAFRDDVSNVGPNEAFLDSQGKMKTLGEQYLKGGVEGESSGADALTVIGIWRILGIVGIVVVWGWL